MGVSVYLEEGSKRTFAGALDWPGWCRSGRDEQAALQALLDYGPRFASAIRLAKLGFVAPTRLSEFKVLERLKGDATTDYGAPNRIPARDAEPVDEAELRRLQAVLKACWRTFDEAVTAARGKTLRAGPRGGGRDPEKMVEHVRNAHAAYVSKLGWKAPAASKALDQKKQLQDTLAAVAASAHGELPAQGPRGGAHWPTRYFVRRAAWHILDHAWEIEDRLQG